MTPPKPPAVPPASPPPPPPGGAPAPKGGDATPQPNLREVADLLRIMGQVVNNAGLYGPEHKRTLDSFDQSYGVLLKVLEAVPRINLSMADGGLLIDGRPLGVSNPFINVLAAKLDQLQIYGFSLLKGMSMEEFGKLTELLIMAKPTEGTGFADMLSDFKLEHVQTEKVKYERVREGDVVLGGGAAEKEQAERAATETVQQITAFLRGDGGPGSQGVAEGLSKMASSNAEELAGLIMEAATVRQRTASISTGETLGDIVVGCLRRTFDGLLQDPAAKTLKGKKAMKRTLMVLEKSILEKLRGLTPEPDPALDAAIAQAIEEMTDDVEVDTLSADYARKMQALEKTEKRMVRYMRMHGEDPEAVTDLHSKLAESGVSMDGWRQLVVKSESAPPVPVELVDVPQPPAEVGMLAVLLKELNEMMSAQADPKVLSRKLAEVGKKAKDVAAFTEKKIDEFGQVVAAEKTSEAKKLSRRGLVTLLAEITQELCQSVSAINCSVSMTLAGHVGDINEDQREVLTVAADCTHRLDLLLDKLIDCVGVPQGLTPDKDLVYNKPTGKA